MPAVTSLSPVKFDSAGTPNDRLTVTFLNANRSSGTVYYKSTSDVSSTSNDGSLTPGQSVTLDRSSKWFIAAQDASGNPASAQVTAAPPVEQALVGDLFRLNPTTATPQYSGDHGATWTDIAGGVLAGGYVADGSQIPNQGTGIKVGLSTGGIYSDNTAANLFHFASYVFNDGTRNTVSVFGMAKGTHVWGSNFVAYGGETAAPSGVIGCEIDFGNLNNSSAAASLFGLDIVSIGGNVGGVFPPTSGAFIQLTTNNALSQVPTGLKFNAGTFQPIGTQTGTKIAGTLTSGSNQVTSVSPTTGYSNGDFITGSGIPGGTTISGGAGTSTLTISANATSSGAIGSGGGFVFTSGTGTLISGGGSIVNRGLDFSAAVFTEAAIFLGAGGNIKFDTVTGTKIGTATGQKIGFWNATPVVRQALSYSRAGAGETAAGAALRSLLATIGLITDSTTA